MADIASALTKGFIYYKNGVYKNLKSQIKIPKLIIINSGKPKESTKEMVDFVASNYNKNKSILKQLGDITEKIYECLSGNKKHAFNKLVNENQKLLEELGVVSNNTKKILSNYECAKISGAGGIKKASGIIISFNAEVVGFEPT